MTREAPPSAAFPAYPASWYLYCATSELGRRPLAKTILGRPLVAIRTEGGRVAIMEGRCAHLGADLGRGRVVGESIQCPFHNWEYGIDGRCIRIPGLCGDVPRFARLVTYPVEEHFGYVFFFNGVQPLFPLPFFFDCQPKDFVAGRLWRFEAACSWFMLAANGFDRQHFQAVHDRTLIGPPEVDCPAPFARRMRYRAEVTGKSFFDRALRSCVGSRVDVSITSWGGPLILVTGFFARARSYILIAAQPSGSDQTLVEVIVLAPLPRSLIQRALLETFGLWVRRWFTQAFMRDDIDRLPGIRYNPHTLVESDSFLNEFFDWVASLPQGLTTSDGLLSGSHRNVRDQAHIVGTLDHEAFSKERPL